MVVGSADVLRMVQPGAGVTRREAEAFNAGVSAVLALARATSDRLALQLVDKPTRYNFAMGALDGLAEEGAQLLQSVETEDA